MDDYPRRHELAEFLRSRRERIRPNDAGLATNGRRRTPGLRREEVAQLAGVSVTWYTWLEQARDITVSSQVVQSLAKALQLSEAEHEHLTVLAGDQSPPTSRTAHPILQRLVDVLDPNPAYLRTTSWDLLAWNQAQAGLWGDPSLLPASERNLLWLVFTDPAMRTLVHGWAGFAQRLLAQYRAAAGKHAGDPRFDELTTRLHAASPEFGTWWDRHDIATFRPARMRIEHPVAGSLTVDFLNLATPENPGVTFVTCLPADPSTASRLPGLLRTAPGRSSPHSPNSGSP